MDDPYLYPGKKILKNKFNIQELEKLDEVEYHFSDTRRIEILEQFKELGSNLDL